MRYNTMFTVTEDEREKMADAVTDIITDEFEQSLIRHFIKESYPLLEEDEIKIIEAYTIEERESRGVYKKHRENLKREVLNFLSENGQIIPKGFVDFRMRDIYTDIKKLVFYGAERFFNEQEYEEFICLLKMVINERESREKLVHVVFNGNEVKLFNKRGSDITEKYEAEFMLSAAQCGAKSEDLAISAIISIAPEFVVIHNLPEKSPMGITLKKLFGSNAQTCQGCEICKKG